MLGMIEPVGGEFLVKNLVHICAFVDYVLWCIKWGLLFLISYSWESPSCTSLNIRIVPIAHVQPSSDLGYT